MLDLVADKTVVNEFANRIILADRLTSRNRVIYVVKISVKEIQTVRLVPFALKMVVKWNAFRTLFLLLYSHLIVEMNVQVAESVI
jgi:hypothetical protein